MPGGPWWFRFLWWLSNPLYGYGFVAKRVWLDPEEPEDDRERRYRYAIACGYESALTILGRRRGWLAYRDTEPGVPVWLVGLQGFAQVARNSRRQP